MKLVNLTLEELTVINGGEKGRYDHAYHVGQQYGDLFAGALNGFLTVIGLKGLFKK